MLYLMSIKPLFARQIYSERKGFELRKRGRIKEGSRIILYETAPLKAITGEFKAGRILLLKFSDVYRMIVEGKLRGCDKRDLDYVRGGDKIQVIEILNSKEYNVFLRLRDLRALVPRFVPPRSYIKLNKEKYRPLIRVINEFSR